MSDWFLPLTAGHCRLPAVEQAAESHFFLIFVTFGAPERTPAVPPSLSRKICSLLRLLTSSGFDGFWRGPGRKGTASEEQRRAFGPSSSHLLNPSSLDREQGPVDVNSPIPS